MLSCPKWKPPVNRGRELSVQALGRLSHPSAGTLSSSEVVVTSQLAGVIAQVRPPTDSNLLVKAIRVPTGSMVLGRGLTRYGLALVQSFEILKSLGPEVPSRPQGLRAGSRRKRELAWRSGNAAVLQERYAGKWVVLEGEVLVAHGSSPTEVVRQARNKGIATPYVFWVEPERSDAATFGL